MREISSQQQIKTGTGSPVSCVSSRRQRGDDTKNRIREIEGSLELYTGRKADQDLEKQIEEKVLFDVEFRKYQAQIPQEDTTQTAYDFTITQKK